MTITSRQNPLVARYRAAARGDATEAMLLDGVHLVGEAIRAGLAIAHAAVTPAAQAEKAIRDLVAALSGAGVPIATVSEQVMGALSPVRSSSGIVALAPRPSHPLEHLYTPSPPFVVVAVDVQDPGNLGAMARVAEAGGATGMVAAGVSADPFGWKALRGAMGSSLRLPIASASPAAAVAEARRHGCLIAAAVPCDGRSLYSIDFRGPVAMLVGGEGPGLPPSIVADADERVSIPMHPPVESLNAAVAAALIVYEARRQRSGSVTKPRSHEVQS